ncbi:MAG TPA: hypothetical protein PKA88_15055, partial [Polyangiaceae bacterium]|nr:hypothetical protein [Polyangiaceae bacterium]
MASRKKKLFLIFGAFFVGVVVSVGIAAALLLPGYLKDRIVAEAQKRGIQLEPGAVSFGFGWAKVSDARFRLLGVQGLVGTAKQLEVGLDFLEPKSVLATDVSIDTAGSAPLLALEIAEWAKKYPRTLKLPAQAKEIAFTWRERVDQKPWIEIAGGEVAPQGGGAVFRAEAATFAGAPLGKIGASWSSDDAVVGLGFGEEDINRAPVRISVQHALPQPKAKIELMPVKAERLAGPLGVKLPIENVTASGSVELQLPAGVALGPVTGTLSVKLKGYVPPHPRELDGIVFGDTTTNRILSSTFTNSYRVLDTALSATNRELHEIEISVGHLFKPGTYWIEWGVNQIATPTLAVFAPPVTINGVDDTGNGLQFNTGV